MKLREKIGNEILFEFLKSIGCALDAAQHKCAGRPAAQSYNASRNAAQMPRDLAKPAISLK